jgi:uncharacterized protein (UPF0332 family)
MFHAATGALLSRGIRRRSHRATLAAFGQTLVKTGELNDHQYRELRAAFERRQQADYEAILQADWQTVADLRERAIDFVDACRKLTP